MLAGGSLNLVYVGHRCSAAEVVGGLDREIILREQENNATNQAMARSRTVIDEETVTTHVAPASPTNLEQSMDTHLQRVRQLKLGASRDLVVDTNRGGQDVREHEEGACPTKTLHPSTVY